MKKWGSIVLVLALIGLLYISFYSKAEKLTFCVSTPICEYTKTNLPCINVRIGQEEPLFLLDLGMTRYASLNLEILKKLEECSLVGTDTLFGWNGKKYHHSVYEIPKFTIENLSFLNIPTVDEDPSFETNAKISGSSRRDHVQGKLGWQFFQRSNLFLDLAHSQIIFADSFQTLQKNGYFSSLFSKIPFSLEKNFIEIETQTPQGPLHCIFDTGATWNFLNREGNEITTLPSFLIEKQEYGPISFHHLPIAVPVKVEAVLGMEFFSKNQVFIDFQNNQIYIARAETDSK